MKRHDMNTSAPSLRWTKAAPERGNSSSYLLTFEKTVGGMYSIPWILRYA